MYREKCDNGETNNINLTLLRVVSLLLFAFTLIVSASYILPFDQNEYTEIHPERWWVYSLFFLPAAILVVYSFAYKIKAHFCETKIYDLLMHFAELTPYMYLIHRVILDLIYRVIYHLPVDVSVLLQKYIYLIDMVMGLIVTIVAAEMWVKISHYFKIRLLKLRT